jgi:hypothetical protein
LEDYFVEQRTTLFIGGLLCLSEDYSAIEDYSAVTPGRNGFKIAPKIAFEKTKIAPKIAWNFVTFTVI